MSRIGRKPIPIPSGVEVKIEGKQVCVVGPKGELVREFPFDLSIQVQESTVIVSRLRDGHRDRAFHGLVRSLLANMVTGVSSGFQKTIDVIGVGYRAQSQGGKLVLSLGFSYPVELTPPPGVQVTDLAAFTPTSANGWLSSRFTVAGIDKQQVGQFAADLRRLRPADPYKGKGLKYTDEILRRKAGKAGRAAKSS
ncbi:MAG: 50S ribosomal protein L6 [Chloroflexi bacterium]|nr:50S ribosomal protein L6 [Chloroflexota bacterium]